MKTFQVGQEIFQTNGGRQEKEKLECPAWGIDFAPIRRRSEDSSALSSAKSHTESWHLLFRTHQTYPIGSAHRSANLI
jgi:hypothetical protein